MEKEKPSADHVLGGDARLNKPKKPKKPPPLGPQGPKHYRKTTARDRFGKCRTCAARIQFSTRDGRHVAVNDDGSLHPCEDA